MVYEMNLKDLARYLAETKLEITPAKVLSRHGKRVNEDGTFYEISVSEIRSCKIKPDVDCFLDTRGIAVRIYIPEFEYTAVTNEESTHYQMGTHLPFSFKASARVLDYWIKDSIIDKTTFEMQIQHLAKAITDMIESEINEWKGNKDWKFVGTKAEVGFEVTMRKG